MRRDVDDELRARLREAAEAHQPDRARIWARVERGMSGQAGAADRHAPPGVGDRHAVRRPAPGWLRVAGATAAVAGVLVAGGYAVAAALQQDTRPARDAVAVSPTPTPSPEATGRPPVPSGKPTPGAKDAPRRTADPTRPTPAGTPARRPSSPAVPSAPASGVADGPLWSDGSVDPHSNAYWAQSNVTLKTTSALTALTVRLEIAQTGGVASTGAWRSLPEEDFALTVRERDGVLVYTWVLRQGRTVPAGTWVFAGQYDHRRGDRDAGADRYAATATTADATSLSVAGDFAPRGDNAEGSASGSDPGS
ncbi:hypothetical protein [Streptomyces tritici]|uniref:hypothetical protein n=1 Tax=Streptomyces tritici TaxID=2054410 RepID=UPI003AF0840B